MLRLHYGGHDCVIEPHAFGVTKNGEPLLLGYQIDSNGAGPGSAGGWAHFYTVKLAVIEPLHETFAGTRPGYTQNCPIFDTILIQL